MYRPDTSMMLCGIPGHGKWQLFSAGVSAGRFGWAGGPGGKDDQIWARLTPGSDVRWRI
jgi:hypothetical protein